MIWNSATKICLILIVVSIIALNFVEIDVKEPLKTIAIMITSFYFGQKSLTGSTDATLPTRKGNEKA